MSASPRRILVVDDQASILFAVGEYLASRGFTVDCARDPIEAAACLDRGAYDVVIADLRLTPNRDDEGLELLGRVRARTPGTRRILLTAYGSHVTESEARRRGADSVLHKPQPMETIVRLVEALLGPPR